MRAEEARRITDNIISGNDYDMIAIRRIYDKIEKATRKGKCFIDYDGRLEGVILEDLINNGYSVDKRVGIYFYRISW